ncbi:MAG: allophanate hydrolase [Polyangiales bacterium]
MSVESRLDVRSLHAAYASGALTPASLLRAIYDRMDADKAPAVWIARVELERALARARELGEFRAELPLFGIPFAVKDNVDVAGLPTTAACPAFSYLPKVSSPAVAALLRAGAICLGKLNLDQFATGLVGSRSPYGACQNVFDPGYLSGGSSSGSGVAVASHYVTFALGTDTAGSGRVPAALNNIVGLKPSVGLLSNEGMVPACASLDCLTVFASTVDDAALARRVMTGDTRPALPRPAKFKFATPSWLEFFGNQDSKVSWERAVRRLEQLGGEAGELDFAPFRELGDMLYGPFVVERLLGVGEFIEGHQNAVLPVTRNIILGGKKYSASDAFQAFQRLTTLRAQCVAALRSVDFMLLPTVPTHFTLAEEGADPATNDKLGIYTRFANFLGCPVLSVPADFRADGLPFGVSLLALPGEDRKLDALADAMHRLSDAGTGKLRHALPLELGSRPAPAQARLAVVGAHMRGLALNQQLQDVNARYVATVRTAPIYKFYVLPDTKPERPGMVQTKEGGTQIELELWDMSWEALGQFMAKVPAPLTIGSVHTEDGELVKGFLCESFAVQDARDISSFGGYRNYLANG